MKKIRKFLSFIYIFFLFCSFVFSFNPLNIFTKNVIAQENWWDGSWDYRKLITWNTSQISGTLYNFPCLLNITDSDLQSYAQVDGDDICFIDYYDNSTQFKHEIEYYDNSDGTLIVWINDTILSSSNNKVWMYFGNSGASNQQDVVNTWDSSFSGVWHLKDNTSSIVDDSTINNLYGTKYAANEPLESTGVVYKSEYFDGINDNITVLNNALLIPGTSDYTLEFWIGSPFPSVPAYWDGIISKGVSGSADAHTWGVLAYNADNDRLQIVQATNAGAAWDAVLPTTASGLSAGWHYIVGQRIGSTLSLYVDGILDSYDSSAGDDLTSTRDFLMGRDDMHTPIRYFDGYLDEVRMSKGIGRSSDFILTNYNNIVNATINGFFIIGSLESPGEEEIVTNSNPSPSNGAIDQGINPTLIITVNDNLGYNMNVTFRTNASGTWNDIGTNSSVGNGTYYQIPTTMDDYDTTFYWSVNTSSVNNVWDNDTYYFTTTEIITYINTISPYVQSSSPLALTCTGNADLDNVSLYYSFNENNITRKFFDSMFEGDIDSTGLNYPNTVDVADGYAFVANYLANTVSVFDVSDPENFVYKSSKSDSPYTTDAHACVVTHDSDYCYVLTTVGTAHLSVYNSTVKTSLSRINAITLPVGENGFYLTISDDDNTLFVTTTSHLLIYNITNKFTGQLDLLSNTLVESTSTVCWLPTLYNNYVYVPSGVTTSTPNPASTNGLYVYDITDKTSPVLRNIINDSTICTAACQIHTHSNGFTYLFYAGRTRLYQASPYYSAISYICVYNISANNATHPSYMYGINITADFGTNGTSGWGVFQHDYLYLNTNNWEDVSSPDYQNGFFVYNFTDIDNPSFEDRMFGKGSPTFLDYTHFFVKDKTNLSDETVFVVTQDDDSLISIVTNWTLNYDAFTLYDVDNNYPWGGNFNFPYGVGYYEFYSQGKKIGSPNELLPLMIDTSCYYYVEEYENNCPSFDTVSPENNSINVPVNLSDWSLYVYDVDGNDTDGSIYLSNGDYYEWFGEGNNTFYLTLSPLDYDILYTVWVNVSDEFCTQYWVFYFTTELEGSNITNPIVTTNSSSNITSNSVIIYGYLNNDGNDSCELGFEYGDSISYGNISYLDNLVFAIGDTTNKVYSYYRNNLTKIHESSSYGGIINGIDIDENYVYAGGSTTQKIYKYYKTNLTKITESVTYSFPIYCLDIDDNYVYVGGGRGTIYQLWKSNLTLKIESSDYGGIIYSLVVDDDYVYVGGLSTQKVYQYWKSNMTKKAETDVYGNIYTINVDNESVYVGGNVDKVYKYYKSNLTKDTESLTYGDTIRTIIVDPYYLYIGGDNIDKIFKLYKSNLTKITEATYLDSIKSIDLDSNYVYVGGGTFLNGKVYKYYKNNLTYIAESSAYGGNIKGIGIFDGFNSNYEFNDSLINLVDNTTYHYRAFAINNNGTGYGSDNTFITSFIVASPTNLSGELFDSYLNITWDKGWNADTTMIRKKTTGYPSSITDGVECQNNSATFYNESISGIVYYSLWSYNSTLNDFSEQVNFTYGGLQVNVFDEKTELNITGWNIFISNLNGSQVYSESNCNNTLTIDVSECPQGIVSILINATGYNNRIYSMSIYTGSWYTLNAYLPPITPPGGGGGIPDCEQRVYIDSVIVTNPDEDTSISLTHVLDEMISVEIYNITLYGSYGGWLFVPSSKYNYTTTQVIVNTSVIDENISMVRVNYYYEFCEGDVESALYYIRIVETVVTDYTSYDQAVENAFVEIKKYINNTGSYELISSLYTDANGYVNVYLIPEINYKVFISKSGFNDTISDYIPLPPNDYGQTTEKWFRLTRTPIPFTPSVPYNFWDIISFNATMYTNGTILVCYLDELSNTSDASFYTYEVYNFTYTLKSTNNTSDDSFCFWVTGINDSRLHQIVVYLNQSNLGFEIVSINVLPVNLTTEFNTSNIEAKIVNVFGNFNPGYVNFFLIYLPAIIIIVLSAPLNVGLGMIGSGLYLGGASQFISVPTQVLILIPFIITLGVLYILAKEGKIKL